MKGKKNQQRASGGRYKGGHTNPSFQLQENVNNNLNKSEDAEGEEETILRTFEEIDLNIASTPYLVHKNLTHAGSGNEHETTPEVLEVSGSPTPSGALEVLNNLDLVLDLPSPPTPFGKKETRRMTKNILVVSFAFLLLFTAYNGLSNVLSSLYADNGLGTYTNATVYFFLIISSLFLPSIAMRAFTAKWALTMAMFGYTFYMGAQYYPRFYTMLPGAAAVGICAAPLWASKSFYLTHVGNKYAELTRDKEEIIIIRFFGIFFFLFQQSQIWGNLISSTIFSTGEQVIPNSTQIARCGISFCPGDLFPRGGEDEEASDDLKRKTYIYSGVCLACAFAAIALVSFFMDPLSRYGEKERLASLPKRNAKDLLMATLKHLANPYQLLLIPLTIFSGLEQGFLSTDFTQAFVTCAMGVHRVGYVLITYGVVDACLSIAFGPVVRRFGRIPVYTLGALMNLAVVTTMWAWKPHPDSPYVFYIVAGMWGASDAIWQTQINSLYGVLFKSNEEAGFSNYRLWESVGFIIAYISGNLLCIRVKLVVLVVVLWLGMTGFYIIEVKEHGLRKREERRKIGGGGTEEDVEDKPND